MIAIYTIIFIIRTNGKIMSFYPMLRVVNSDNVPKLAIGILAVIAIFSRI